MKHYLCVTQWGGLEIWWQQDDVWLFCGNIIHLISDATNGCISTSKVIVAIGPYTPGTIGREIIDEWEE